ncbi:MAG TPA: histidine kinase dimerization/phospho-acceptor domain-containing protein, partial [Pyrinomonadaceae bacterium]
MRRSYFTILLTVSLSVLLVVLGVLQYRWQSEISTNEAQRLHKLVQENAGRFAEDFDKEIQNAYFNFQVRADDWGAANYRPFVERYDFWKEKTAYPDLISEFYFFDAAGKNMPLRFDRATSTFVSADWTPELREIFGRTGDEKTLRAVNADIYTLILPQNEAPQRVKHIMLRKKAAVLEIGDNSPGIPPAIETPKTYGFLAIQLNENVLKSQVLPAIAAKDLGDGDYGVKIIDRKGNAVFQTADITGDGDASAGLFQLSPDNVFFFANRDLETAIAENKDNGSMSTHVESRTLHRTEVTNDSQGAVNVQIERGGALETEIFTTAKSGGPEPPWTLEVQHTAGSIDAYVAGSKTRNLAAGFSILGLMGLAVGAIIFSSQRVKAFAQRQLDFVSSVSHEFRTPLAVIYSAGENLADGVTNDAAQTSKYGELIKGEGRK